MTGRNTGDGVVLSCTGVCGDKKRVLKTEETVSEEPGDATDFEQGQSGEDEILSKEDEKNLEY